MRQALELAFQVAASEATVLLRGESGTGKGVLARAIHERSARAAGPFVIVHCPSLSGELLESELFGHVKRRLHRGGAGHRGQGGGGRGRHAVPRRDRRPAAGGAAEAAASVAGSLLRARRRNADTASPTCALLAATNRDLAAEVAAGRFREDLFYRLNVIEIELPPLRQRPRDILPLAEHLLRFFARQTGKAVRCLHAGGGGGAAAAHTGRATSASCATPSSAASSWRPAPRWIAYTCRARWAIRRRPRVEVGGAVTLDALEAEHIRRVLAASASLDEAAATLGIDPSTLYRKRKRYGL